MTVELAMDLYLRGAVLSAVALLLSWLSRRSSASTRSLVQTLGFAGLFSMPIVLFLVPAIELPVLPVTEAVPDEPAVVATAEFEVQRLAPLVYPEEHRFVPAGEITRPVFDPGAPQPETADGSPWLVAFALVWFAISILLVLQSLVRRAYAVWILRPSQRDGALDAELLGCLGFSRLRVERSDRVQQPCVVGLLRPRVLVPPAFDRWAEERQRAVLCHEAAHVRRCDAWSELLVELGRAVFWPVPLVWWLARDHRLLREQACDDAVLRAGGSATASATELVQIARLVRSSRSSQTAGALTMVRPPDLETRVRALLRTEARRHGPAVRQRLMMACVALVCAVFAGSAVAVTPQEPVPLPPPSPPVEMPVIPEPERSSEPRLTLYLDKDGVIRLKSVEVARDKLLETVVANIGEGDMRRQATLRVAAEASAVDVVVVAGLLKELEPRVSFDLEVGSERPKPIHLGIRSDGSVVYRGRRIGVDGIQPLIRRLLKDGEKRPVVVRASRESKTGVVVRVVDESKLAGAESVSIATPPVRPQNSITVTILPGGDIFCGARRYDLSGFKKAAPAIVERIEDYVIVVLPHDLAPLHLVAQVLEAAERSGAQETVLGRHTGPFRKVGDVDVRPRLISRAQPVITPEMRKTISDGAIQVMVLFVVDVYGRVEEAVVESVRWDRDQVLPDNVRRAFEKAALTAIRASRFVHGERGGKPQPFRLRMPVVFRAD